MQEYSKKQGIFAPNKPTKTDAKDQKVSRNVMATLVLLHIHADESRQEDIPPCGYTCHGAIAP